MKSIFMITVMLFTSSYAEVHGIILNKDKLLVAKSSVQTDPKNLLNKEIATILSRSKHVKTLSNRYAQITHFYKLQLLLKIKSNGFDNNQRDKENRFLAYIMSAIEQNINQIKSIIIKDQETIKALEKQLINVE